MTSSFFEVIAKPSGTLYARVAIPEKCGSGTHVPGNAEGFAITSCGYRAVFEHG